MTDFHQLKVQLLERLINSSIGQAEYDRMLSEIEKLEGATTKTDRSNIETQQFNSSQIFSAPSQLQAGVSLGKFQIETLLGKGGMGEVWKARDIVAERAVVIKTLPAALQNCSEEMAKVKANFQQVHALQHQHICPVYDLGHDEKCGFYLVMKFVEGMTLDVFRDTGSLGEETSPFENLLRVLRPIAEALDYAHSVQVVHRDIKPQNIMVGEAGRSVQVVDFGLAAEIRTSVSRISQVKMDCCGTPPYMAPEQWKAEYQDGKTDQYALGVMAYEWLAGKLPFEAASLEAYAYCAVRSPVPPIASLSLTVNEALTKALAKVRQDRFADCRSFVDLLARGLKAMTKIDQEIAKWTEVMAEEEDDDRAFLERGVQWAIRGNYDKALEDFEAALKRNSRNPMAYYNRGHLRALNGDFQQAIRDYTEAIRGWEGDIRPYLKRGSLWTKIEKPKKALADFEVAIDIDPSDSRGYNARAWLLATCRDSRIRSGKRAIQDATRANELTGWEDFQSLDTLAAAHAEAGNFDEAVRFQQLAIEKGSPTASPARLESFRTRLESYRSKEPYREQAGEG